MLKTLQCTVFSFHSVFVFMFTVYCLMDPCGLISNKDDDDSVGVSKLQEIFETAPYIEKSRPIVMQDILQYCMHRFFF